MGTKLTRRGGVGRGQSRKAKATEAMQVVALRLTALQKEKLQRLGGGAWVRDRIDNAKE